MKGKKRNLILLFTLMILILSCGSRQTIRPGDSLEVAFEKAMGFYERGRYSQAAEAFETVLSIARGTEFAAEAQFYLAESHFHNRSYLMAASEYRRFSRNFTADARRIEAEFMEAYCHYLMSPRFNLDQTETYQALDRFELFISRYPESDKADRAREYILELREKLAKKKFHAAEMYFRIREFRSAALYYELTVENYPESSWAERALVNKILSYVRYAENSVRERKQERFEMAVESYEQYIQIFPRGEHRSLADQYYDQALNGLASLTTITAGR